MFQKIISPLERSNHEHNNLYTHVKRKGFTFKKKMLFFIIPFREHIITMMESHTKYKPKR